MSVGWYGSLWPEAEQALSGNRILVVVGDAPLREAVSLRLAFEGAEVCPVGSIDEALGSYEAFAPDVVVADAGSRAITIAASLEIFLEKPVYPISLEDVLALLGAGWLDA